MTINGTIAPEAMLGVNASKHGPSFTEQTRGQNAAWGNTTRNEGYGVRNPYLSPLLKENETGSSAWYRKIRMMRKHPTVRLSRLLSIAVMAESPWSVKAEDNAPEGAREYVEQHLLPMQDVVMGPSLRGTYDFGWQPFEKIFKFDIDTMYILPAKLKPLLQDQTDIVIQTDTGAFRGIKQFMTFIDVQNVLLITQDVEGTNFYGEGAMPSVEVAYNRWLVSDDSNVRFDRKISGAHWLVHYPPGQTLWAGRLIDNFNIATQMITLLEGSGSIVLPNDLQGLVDNLSGAASAGLTQWKVELQTADSSAQMGFQQRLAYLDTLMVRASGFPERSILEGQYGTKAEAEAHADFAVARMDYNNKQIINQFNKQMVNQLLSLNFGQDAIDKVKIEISPIADDKITMLKQVYMAIIANPAVGPTELGQIDMQAIRDYVGVPTAENAPMQGMGGPDYTGGTGINGNGDPMLEQYLAHLNAPDVQPQIAQQQPISPLAASRA